MKYLVVASSALLVAGCSSAVGDPAASSSEAMVSATTTYLLPVADDVRQACHDTWTNRFCDPVHAQAAAETCLDSLAASGSSPACASKAGGCFELLTTSTPCTTEGPIYPTIASCSAPVERTCAFYSQCLEASAPCGDSGYALGYGEKYCSRYDADTGFSPQGIVWRDSVLHCLQVSLVPELAKAKTSSCNAVTTFAFDSHPRCYTEGPSICFLPPSDVARVIGTIDGKDILSLRSAKQVATVATTCIAQLAGALFGFDALEKHPSLPLELRDRDALNDRILFWRQIEAGEVNGLSRD